MATSLHKATFGALSAVAVALAAPAWAQNGPDAPSYIDQVPSNPDGPPTLGGPLIVSGTPITGSDVFTPDGPDGLPPAFDLLPPGVPTGNASAIVQTGFGNVVEVVATGSRNRTAQHQAGDNNSSVINVFGSRNNAVTDQDGNDNAATLTIRGSGSAIAAIQQGNAKRIRIEHNGPPTGLTVRQTN